MRYGVQKEPLESIDIRVQMKINIVTLHNDKWFESTRLRVPIFRRHSKYQSSDVIPQYSRK